MCYNKGECQGDPFETCCFLPPLLHLEEKKKKKVENSNRKKKKSTPRHRSVGDGKSAKRSQKEGKASSQVLFH